MFLETEGVVLPLNTPVIVGFRLGDAAAQSEFRLPAMVIRRGLSGIGILFLEMSSEVTGALHDALYRESYNAEKSAEIVLAGARVARSRALIVNG